MATGASNAELAILLVDARKGLLVQTHRHAAIAALMGIRHVVLAVNKLDLVQWDRGRFEEIVAAFNPFGERLGFRSVVAIPLSARHGDNVISESANTGWYKGPTLLEHLENVEIEADLAARPFRLPVQTVLRPSDDARFLPGRYPAELCRAATGSPSLLRGGSARSRTSRFPASRAKLPLQGTPLRSQSPIRWISGAGNCWRRRASSRMWQTSLPRIWCG
jgi:bifunctional enzyme CysN/CysC